MDEGGGVTERMMTAVKKEKKKLARSWENAWKGMKVTRKHYREPEDVQFHKCGSRCRRGSGRIQDGN